MNAGMIVDGLMFYVGLIVLLTFHEFGHAWMALKCGDDTAKLQGRVSLNPIVHMDLVGTVILPLMMIFLSMSGSGLGRFLLGWAKPVPVNPYNLKNPKVDDILVTLAGPWMNLILAVMFVGFAKGAQLAGVPSVMEFCVGIARISLLLCFFNLIPIPPLDGSQVVRALSGMSYETYAKFARWGFVIIIVVLQIPVVREVLGGVTGGSLTAIASWFNLPLG
jgi:Zn-dependent protease